jgi:hypothetical protein
MQKAVLRKCSCNSSWCPTCYKRQRTKKLTARIQQMSYRRVRFVTLTIDRNLYPDGPESCYREIREKKGIAQFIHNLKRTSAHNITDYAWFMEWHRDGFPHWHVFVELEESGKAAMLGNRDLLRHWKRGAVYESYFTTAAHWYNATGYFKKHGYWEKGKKHQAILPDWARVCGLKIRRSDSSHKKRSEYLPETVLLLKKAHEFTTKEIKKCRDERKADKEMIEMHGQRQMGCNDEPEPFRGYDIILSECGAKTEVIVQDSEGFHGFSFIVDIPYLQMVLEFKNGKYLKGLGYFQEFTDVEYERFMCKFGRLEVTHDLPF